MLSHRCVHTAAEVSNHEEIRLMVLWACLLRVTEPTELIA
jgi:hypothetical protein